MIRDLVDMVMRAQIGFGTFAWLDQWYAIRGANKG